MPTDNIDESLKSLLPSIKVYPFPPISLSRIDGYNYNTATVECPKCLAQDNFYNTDDEFRFQGHYCSGNQPAEYECGHKDHYHPNSCAGIIEEHFHVKCSCCGYIFFLSIPVKEGN